jgi:hypothetical protein
VSKTMRHLLDLYPDGIVDDTGYDEEMTRRSMMRNHLAEIVFDIFVEQGNFTDTVGTILEYADQIEQLFLESVGAEQYENWLIGEDGKSLMYEVHYQLGLHNNENNYNILVVFESDRHLCPTLPASSDVPF